MIKNSPDQHLNHCYYLSFAIGMVAHFERRGGSMVACQTVVLQSWVRIWHLPSPQLTANLLVACHMGWHLAAGWPLWGAKEEKITKNEPLVHQKHIKKKKVSLEYRSEKLLLPSGRTSWGCWALHSSSRLVSSPRSLPCQTGRRRRGWIQVGFRAGSR
jgi:hypothetical protein